MTNYTALVAAKGTTGAIKTWVNRDNLDVETILTEAEQLIYDRLRVREMLASPQASTLTIGADTLALPARYLATRVFRFTGIYKKDLRRRLLEDVEAEFNYDSDGNRVNGEPTMYYATATTLQFDQPADVAYPYRWIFYQRPAPLSAGNATNFLTETKPSLLRAMCMAKAAEFLKDQKEKTYWLGVAGELIDAANAENDRELLDLDLRVIPQ